MGGGEKPPKANSTVSLDAETKKEIISAKNDHNNELKNNNLEHDNKEQVKNNNQDVINKKTSIGNAQVMRPAPQKTLKFKLAVADSQPQEKTNEEALVSYILPEDNQLKDSKTHAKLNWFDLDPNNHDNVSYGSDEYGKYMKWHQDATRGGGFQLSIDERFQEYSIGLKFSFENTDGSWRKIIDYSNGASDVGFYFHSGGYLNFYPYGGNSGMLVNNGQVVNLIVSRSNKEFAVYLIDDRTHTISQIYDLKDTGTLGSSIPYESGKDTILGFFFDDSATNGEYTPGGKLYSLAVYDKAINVKEIKKQLDGIPDKIKAAKEAIENAKKEAENAIKAMPGLTEENKKLYQEQVDKGAASAESLLDDKTLDKVDVITKIQNQAIANIQRDEAKAEVRAEADEAEKKLKDLKNIDEGKAQEEIEAHERAAEEKIARAQDKDGIDKEKNAGKLQIDKDSAVDVIKSEQAKKDEEARKEVDKTDIDKAAQTAIDAINKIDTTDTSYKTDIEKERKNGVFNIDAQGAIARVNESAKEAEDKVKADPALTDDQAGQQAAKDKIDKERDDTIADIKKRVVDALTKPDTIEQVTKQIDDEADSTVKTIRKEPAIADVEHAAKEENKKINSNQDLKDKTEALGKVEKDRKEAEDAISNTDDSSADKIAQEGVKKIQLENDKASAKERVKKEAEKETVVVNGLQPLTKEEQAAYQKSIEAKKQETLSKIDSAEDEKGITDAETSGKTAIDRESAKAAIDNEAEQITKNVNSLTNVDEQVKNDAIASIKKDQDQYKKDLDNPTATPDQQSVTDTRDKGKKKIDEDGDVAANAEKAVKEAKQAANTEIENAKKKAEEDIEKMPDLSPEEKAAAKKKVDDKVKEARGKISSAKKKEDVDKNKAKGVADINQEDAKARARNEVNHEAHQAEEAIKNLSNDEKQKAEANIKKDANDANNAIDQAQDKNGIDDAKNGGIKKIAKDSAVASVEDAAKKQEATIKADPALANDKKAQDEAIVKIETDKKLAEDQINKPNASADEIKQAASKRVKKIIREDAKADVAHEVAKIKAEIDRDRLLTPEERQKATAEVDQKAQKASKVIDDATDNEIEDAKNKVIADIDKTGAEAEIRNEAKKAEQEINFLDSLAPTEKEAYIKKKNEDAEQVIKNIEQAQTADKVEEAKKDGLKRIDREQAKAEIDNEAKKITKDIEGLKNVDDQAKKEAEQNVEADRQQAKADIDNPAKTPDQTSIKTVTDAGKQKIDEEGRIAASQEGAVEQAKTDAKAEIEKAKKQAKADIENKQLMPGLSDEERKAAEQKIDEQAKKVEDAIDSAKGKEATDKAKTEGLENIKQEEAKAKANDAIDQAVCRVEDKIKNLPDAAKKVAEENIAKDAKKANDDVNSATDQKSIDQAKKAGINKIARDGAAAQIRHAAVKVTTDIEGLKHVSAKTQEEAKGNVNRDENGATYKINDPNATVEEIEKATAEGIKKIEEDGKLASDQDNVINKAKEKAKKEIERIANQAKQDIENKNLSPEERQAAEQKISDNAQKAKNAIDQAKSTEEVSKGHDEGKTSINIDQIKAEAKAEINDEAKQAKAEIDSRKNLSEEEKRQAKDQIDKDAKQAKEGIGQAADTDAISKGKEDGIIQIRKDVAKAAIQDEANKVKQEIDELPNLTLAEKQKYKDEVDRDAREAKNNIDSARDISSIASAQKQGIKKIDEDGAIAKKESMNARHVAKAKMVKPAKRISKPKAGEELPQAGAKDGGILGVIGWAIATAGSLLGLGADRKRRKK